jgi:hypothetical protein
MIITYALIFVKGISTEPFPLSEDSKTDACSKGKGGQ